MPGIKIGDGVIIATNSTVVKDVEPYTIYGGIQLNLSKNDLVMERLNFYETFNGGTGTTRKYLIILKN